LAKPCDFATGPFSLLGKAYPKTIEVRVNRYRRIFIAISKDEELRRAKSVTRRDKAGRPRMNERRVKCRRERPTNIQ